MKARIILSLLGGALLFASQAQAAGQHTIPTAPAEFLSMVSPIKADEMDEATLKAGAKIYTKKCAKCHGETGDGKGSAAGELTIKPVDMSAPGYMAGRKDGQLFWILRDGSPNTDMKGFGPGSEQNFSDEEMWKVIAYMRATFTK